MHSNYSRVYLIGENMHSQNSSSPFNLNPGLMILEQYGNRISHRVFYLNEQIKPIGKIKIVVPEGPDSPSILMDSAIAFYPEWFKECRALP